MPRRAVLQEMPRGAPRAASLDAKSSTTAIAAPWVAVEGFGTMDLKVTTFDAVLYEGASRGIPTTKLHSMYSRKLAAGAAVGAGHSNLYVCALPRDIDVRHIALTSGTHRPHSTQQASAIRPDASSKQRRGDRRFAVFGSGTCTRRLVHLRKEVGECYVPRRKVAR